MRNKGARLVRRFNGYWLYHQNGSRQFLAKALTSNSVNDDLKTVARNAATKEHQ